MSMRRSSPTGSRGPTCRLTLDAPRQRWPPPWCRSRCASAAATTWCSRCPIDDPPKSEAELRNGHCAQHVDDRVQPTLRGTLQWRLANAYRFQIEGAVVAEVDQEVRMPRARRQLWLHGHGSAAVPVFEQ